jgi:hypothetical protein
VPSFHLPTMRHVSTSDTSTPTTKNAPNHPPAMSSIANSAATSPGHAGMLTSACATCHPSSGDTCHLNIGQTICRKCQKCMTRVMPRSCHVSCTDMPRHCTAATSAVRPATSAVRPAQSASKFSLFGSANRPR